MSDYLPSDSAGLRSNHPDRQRPQCQLSQQDERVDRQVGSREETKARCEDAQDCSVPERELLVKGLDCIAREELFVVVQSEWNGFHAISRLRFW